MRFALLAILGAVTLSGCATRPNDALVFTIEQALITAPQGADLGQSVQGEWDRICVFRPYTTYERVDSVIGARWRGARSTNIEQSDSATLLTFLRGTRVEDYVLFPRVKGDWGTPGPEQWYCRSRANAVFQLRQPFDGTIPWIGPADG
jgi:hypothetical protein